MTAPQTRAPRLQHVLTVEETRWLSPHVIRVVLAGESVDAFAGNTFTDAYVKLLFPDPAAGPQSPDGTDAAPERPAVRRTYTVRWVDAPARRLAIDFVVHGDTGIAAPWAAGARPGDELVMVGPSGAYAPDPTTRWHLFAGDLSALPAIAAALEALPAGTTGVALLEVDDLQERTSLKTEASIDVRWKLNQDPSDVGFLARAVAAAGWPSNAAEPGAVQVFAHGEREAIKAIRAVLRDLEIPREAISISGYWARGRTEDRFQAEKREPIGQID